MTRRARLDTELVRRGLVASRTDARRAIERGEVLVEGFPGGHPDTLVAPDTPLALTVRKRFVSRGGEKLDAALAELTVTVGGRKWLDAGASTGGFTDRLLQGGAAAVVSVDVGYGQLDWGLRNDARVIVMERSNLRELVPEDLPWRPQGVVADLSFISLSLVLPVLVDVAMPDADFILLVKPQFEVGRERVGKGGVVRDPDLWRQAVVDVVDRARGLGLALVGAVPSRLPGPAGNREFFIHLRADAPHDEDAIDRAIDSLKEETR